MFVVIPAKPFHQSKTRLAGVLSPADRVQLSRRLLQRTIGLARQAGRVVVISTDAAVRHTAKRHGAWALVEAGTGLNAAVQQAAVWAALHGADSVLVLPADLPWLQPVDLQGVIAAGQQAGRAVVIAPCRRNDGTNALLLRPPGVMRVAFGPGSFNLHRQMAVAAGVLPIIYHSPTLAFDLDLPEDLAQLYSPAPARP
jgi:2-phospho-L-lactate guanylyltransferase